MRCEPPRHIFIVSNSENKLQKNAVFKNEFVYVNFECGESDLIDEINLQVKAEVGSV